MINTPAVSTYITAAALFLACRLVVAPFLDSGHPGEPPQSQPVQSDLPRFEIFWLRGELRLAGHTVSSQHEEDLLQAAADSYPNRVVATTLEPFTLLPDFWADSSIQVLYALAGTLSAHAVLSRDALVIRGVTEDQSAWLNRLLDLRQSLPDNVNLSTDMLTVPNDFRLADSCNQALGQFTAGPIRFEKSSAVFRSSAYPALERIVALANACRDSEILITGHTDASGEDSWNLRLSLQRAHAVADYLEHGGIDLSRTIVTGAGSSEPLADNNTSYGRSLNRRIDVVLRSAQP